MKSLWRNTVLIGLGASAMMVIGPMVMAEEGLGWYPEQWQGIQAATSEREPLIESREGTREPSETASRQEIWYWADGARIQGGHLIFTLRAEQSAGQDPLEYDLQPSECTKRYNAAETRRFNNVSAKPLHSWDASCPVDVLRGLSIEEGMQEHVTLYYGGRLH